MFDDDCAARDAGPGGQFGNALLERRTAEWLVRLREGLHQQEGEHHD